MALDMLAAYYDRMEDTQNIFDKLEICQSQSYDQHLNQYDVLRINMQEFLSRSHNVEELIDRVKKLVIRDLKMEYPEVDYFDDTDLIECMQDIYAQMQYPFVVIIDEWDCIFREYKQDKEAQEKYLDFLRDLLKDKACIYLSYMTGILPIKKYGTHSALNMFDEFSMTNPGPLAAFTGFTEWEVKVLCEQYKMDFFEIQRWYDGYCFGGDTHIYNPRSVVSAMLTGDYDNFWNKTETFEALRNYIVMNYKGLKDTVVNLLAGGRRTVNTNTFSNDMTTFQSADDVLTLLVHLGYLGYDFISREVFIPNSEISSEFCNAVESAGWDMVVKSIEQSKKDSGGHMEYGQ